MKTVTVEVKNDNGLKLLHDLELNNIIRIVEEPAAAYSLPGDAIRIEEFRKWVIDAENMPTVSLKEAKTKWEQKKKRLKKITR